MENTNLNKSQINKNINHIFPVEIIEKILTSAGSRHHHLFMSVCRSWYKIIQRWRYSKKFNHKRISYISDSVSSVQYLKWAIQNGLCPKDEDICRHAIQKGNVVVLKFSLEKKWSTISIDDYEPDYYQFITLSDALIIPAKNNDIDMLDFIYIKYYDVIEENMKSNILESAMRNNSIDIVKWSLEKAFNIEYHHFILAVKSDLKEIINLFRDFQITNYHNMVEFMIKSSKSDNFEDFRFFINNGYSFDLEKCMKLIKYITEGFGDKGYSIMCDTFKDIYNNCYDEFGFVEILQSIYNDEYICSDIMSKVK